MAQQVQASVAPTRKILAGGLSGLASVGLIIAAQRWLGWDIDPDLAGVIVLGIGYGVSYLVPPAAKDRVVELDAELRRRFGGAAILLALGVPLACSACDPLFKMKGVRFADRAEPVLAQGCAAFERAEASPLVQLAVAGGSIASPAAGTAVGVIKAFGNRFCIEGPPPGDTTSTAERAAWLAKLTADLPKAAEWR